MDILTLAMAKAYTDSQRIASAETNKYAICDNFELMSDTQSSTTMSNKEHFVEGAKCLVTISCYANFGGTEKISETYSATVKRDGSSTGLYVGNLSKFKDAENTGEKFLLYNKKNMLICFAEHLLPSASGICWITCEVVEETIHPIDPKYLPGVCLPVVEIADYTALTEAECAALDKAESNNAPIVVKFNFNGIDICCALARMNAEGITIFSGVQLLLETTWKIVLNNEGGWTMTITE